MYACYLAHTKRAPIGTIRAHNRYNSGVQNSENISITPVSIKSERKSRDSQVRAGIAKYEQYVLYVEEIFCDDESYKPKPFKQLQPSDITGSLFQVP